ncbi:hypothetical protein EJB05_37986 [Eragrostis curvula]|uniref:Uncharacterized protein n=1 Tax=Eragrostis curvula TaxID=38414 RepID=A0A5J9TT23_9POAL|nr:hypothetical protein EJB05_37986 [Eragrostis curvula]
MGTAVAGSSNPSPQIVASLVDYASRNIMTSATGELLHKCIVAAASDPDYGQLRSVLCTSARSLRYGGVPRRRFTRRVSVKILP